MKHLTILIPDGPGNNLSSIVGPYKIFTKANEYWKMLYDHELFKIQLAGSSEETEFYEGLFTVRPHLHFKNINQTDLIIIPSLNHQYTQALKFNNDLSEWIYLQYTKGAEVASICTGAFLLASSGLLNGRSCSTHWSVEKEFEELFPKVKLQTDKIITDENGIYSNGGAYSFLNLVIYLIEKYYDRPTAIYCSKVFQIEMDRKSQSVFSIFKGQKNHGDEVVSLAQQHIEENFREKINVDDLCNKFNVGRRTFDRRFLKATGNSPLEYTQRVRIEWAKKAFESNRKTISEVMYETGYNDSKAFREVFRKITGLLPAQYKEKFNRN